MGFQLVTKSVILNDHERRNGCYFALFYKNRQIWGIITSKWLEINPYCQRQKC